MMKASNIDVQQLPEEDFDQPLGTGTGAAVIFGATGGVMEAALRSAYYLVCGENPPAEAFTAVRGGADWREAEFDVNGITVKTAVASGLANARKLISIPSGWYAVNDAPFQITARPSSFCTVPVPPDFREKSAAYWRHLKRTASVHGCRSIHSPHG